MGSINPSNELLLPAHKPDEFIDLDDLVTRLC